MYETDLLLFICFALLFVYFKSSFDDFVKYIRLFRNIKGPKTLPFSLMAYIFTARSGSGEWSIKVSSASTDTASSMLLITADNFTFQTAFKSYKTSRNATQTSTVFGSERNISSSPTIRASHKSFSPFRNASRRTFSWSCSASPTASSR